MRRRLGIGVVVLFVATLIPGAAPANETDNPYLHLVGALHNHSGYSDGWPGTTPATYYAKGKAAGLDFLSGSEHSDNADIPVTAKEECLSELLPSCIGGDADSLRKWDATLEQANAATTATFTGLRGFEWTSDRFGHINVYFSEHDTNAKIDGGYAVMDAFWKWFTSPIGLGGGADGLATFNHPGAKSLDDADPALNWNDFAYVPEADHRMVGIEVYNDADDFGTTHPGNRPPVGYYVHALDKGWHVGAVGAEDLHGDPGHDDQGGIRWPKTVILSNSRSREALREAMLERRFYAIRRNDGLRLDFTVDDEVMGSRLARKSGTPVHIEASTNRPSASVEVVTSGGRIVASGLGAVDTHVNWKPDDRYYFMRVKAGAEYIGYSSPMWITRAAVTQGEWLAGDLHVHTCYSHDSYCGPDDHNTGPEEFYTLGGTVEERFLEASVRGLDYLAITDHHSDGSPQDSGFQRSVDDPAFGSHGVVGIQAYENSLHGHAQMIGAKRIYPGGNHGVADVNAMAEALRADGGSFQANHPADQLIVPLGADCSDTSGLDWEYGFEVPVDTVEVWNTGHLNQPPFPAANSNEDAIRYWECWLNAGARVGATGGSDSHWLTLSAVAGVGQPTTWVFARDRTPEAVVDAIREGRTSISVTPPLLGGLRLVLEGDDDGDGIYEAVVGDDVKPGAAMRVRANGLPGAGLVTVRANGETVIDEMTLLPGGTIDFVAPREEGWVRATLSGPDLRAERKAYCDPLVGEQTTYCRNPIAVLAMTSAIYLESPKVATTLRYTGTLVARGPEIRVSARLLTEDGQPVAGKAISFTNRETTVTAVTDSGGDARATMPMPDHGDAQTIDVTFAGDDRYFGSSTSATVAWSVLT